MIDGIESITNASLSLALDASLLRQQVIAANIANANTENYVPRRVDFEAYVREARSQISENGRLDAATVSSMAANPVAVLPRLVRPGMPTGVQLDVEAADMAQNAVQYQALVKGLSRQFGILETAVNDGKR